MNCVQNVSSQICKEPSPVVAQIVLKHISVLEFLKSNEILKFFGSVKDLLAKMIPLEMLPHVPKVKS